MTYNKSRVQTVLDRYNAEHDLGPDCPVTWREEALASAVMDLFNDVDELKKQVASLLAAVPQADKPNWTAEEILKREG